MSKVISGISMSLDGFVTGPNVTRERQLGDGGQVLHRWLHEPDPRDAQLLAGMRDEMGSNSDGPVLLRPGRGRRGLG